MNNWKVWLGAALVTAISMAGPTNVSADLVIEPGGFARAIAEREQTSERACPPGSAWVSDGENRYCTPVRCSNQTDCELLDPDGKVRFSCQAAKLCVHRNPPPIAIRTAEDASTCTEGLHYVERDLCVRRRSSPRRNTPLPAGPLFTEHPELVLTAGDYANVDSNPRPLITPMMDSPTNMAEEPSTGMGTAAMNDAPGGLSTPTTPAMQPTMTAPARSNAQSGGLCSVTTTPAEECSTGLFAFGLIALIGWRKRS